MNKNNHHLGSHALTATEQRMLATALHAAGMDQASITPWLDARRYFPFLSHIKVVLEWATTFTDQALARAWYDTNLLADEARAWSEAGYTPKEADRVAAEVFLRMLDPTCPVPHDQDQWLATGLPPAWVIRCLELGVEEPSAARELFDMATTYAAAAPSTDRSDALRTAAR